jgi:transposase
MTRPALHRRLVSMSRRLAMPTVTRSGASRYRRYLAGKGLVRIVIESRVWRRRRPGSAQSGLPRVELLWADGAYTGTFAHWLADARGWRVEVPRHPDTQLWRYGLKDKPQDKFIVLPRRWVVERTFAWL